jgi:hypothetical protein
MRQALAFRHDLLRGQGSAVNGHAVESAVPRPVLRRLVGQSERERVLPVGQIASDIMRCPPLTYILARPAASRV